MAYRVQHRFWLDLDNPGEAALNDLTVQLRKERTFTATIRDGIRLVCDLRRGRLDVLFELFPWVRAEFLDYMQALQPDKSAAQTRLEQQLARLEQLLQQAGPRPRSHTGTGPHAGTGPLAPHGALGQPRPADDASDAALLTVRKDTRTNSVQNFLNSMMRLQQ